MVGAADQTNQPIFSQWKSPSDWPWTISLMVGEARRILSYYKLPDDWQPPKSIWHSVKKCGEWIDKQQKASKDGKRQAFLEFSDKELEHAN